MKLVMNIYELCLVTPVELNQGAIRQKVYCDILKTRIEIYIAIHLAYVFLSITAPSSVL